MTVEGAVVSDWLKLIVPVPAPKVMAGALIVPATSLVPKPPMFSVPTEPACDATVIPCGSVEAATPPLATVRVPSPASPMMVP